MVNGSVSLAKSTHIIQLYAR